MDPQSIREILDRLDVQLASGKVDLETYHTLADKWRARLAELGVDEASGAANGSPAPAAEAIVCPECSAPIEDVSIAPGEIVRCSFCRATFTLKRAQEETHHASLELRRWLDEMVTDAVGDGAVDAVSRRFIFGEKLYPALQRDYRRSMEPFEDAQQHPLLYFDLLAPLAGYRPRDHVLLSSADALPRVRTLSVRVNSPLVAGFAVADEDRRKLRHLDLQTSSLVYLANVANLYRQPGPDAYGAARSNLAALRQACDECLGLPQEPGLAAYLRAMRARLNASIRALDVLSAIFAPDAEFAPQVFLDELDAAQGEVREAQALCNAAAYDALALIPLRTGLQRDGQAMALLRTLLAAYHAASSHRRLAFPAFYDDLKALLWAWHPHAQSIQELLVATAEVHTMIRARRGAPLLTLVNQWDWCESQVEAGRQRSLLGPSETVGPQRRYWHPFWYASVRYALAKGTLVRSGVEQVGYGLMDATDPGATPSIALPDAPFYSLLSRALEAPQPGDEKPLVPSLIAPAIAERAIAALAHTLRNCRNAQVSVKGLVYLPAVAVRYDSRSGARHAVHACGVSVSASAATLLGQVGPFLERYA